VDKVRAAAFELIRERTRNGAPLQEVEVKDFVREGFAEAGLVTDHGPIVGCNANASNPHYEPTEGSHLAHPRRRLGAARYVGQARSARRGLLRHHLDRPSAATPPRRNAPRVHHRDAARATPPSRASRAPSPRRDPLRGFEVDDACRAVIVKAGYAEYFTHRTGHSIGQEVHGNGANMDNFETHDERRVMPWSCFSIEPGIYLENFGVRSEINMFVGDGDARVTGEIQREMVLL
jgi:Xaa-Pro dipeptidase